MNTVPIAYGLKDISNTQSLVLAALVSEEDFKDEYGNISPSQSQIAVLFGVSIVTVKGSLKALAINKYIKVKGRSGYPNELKLLKKTKALYGKALSEVG